MLHKLSAGPIGLLSAMVAISYGASSVVITDIDDGRLALAKECGVHHAVNVRSENDGEERKWRSSGVRMNCVAGV